MEANLLGTTQKGIALAGFGGKPMYAANDNMPDHILPPPRVWVWVGSYLGLQFALAAAFAGLLTWFQPGL